MISRALANACIIKCSFPLIFLLSTLSNFDNSISTAPPPGIILLVLRTLQTIIIASFRLRSDSLRNCSAPPLSKIVAVLLLGHCINTLYLSLPILLSSNSPQIPRSSGQKSEIVVYILAPVACSTLLISSFATRPAQKTFRSAKYCVAKSPIGSCERTTFAPDR
jgi:hypothetical protein